MRLQVAMCHLQPDSRISLILAAGAFDIILESLDVCSTDHLANLYPSKCTKWCSVLRRNAVLGSTVSQHKRVVGERCQCPAPRTLLLKVASRRNLAMDFFFHASLLLLHASATAGK